jgi:hypothetical protein
MLLGDLLQAKEDFTAVIRLAVVSPYLKASAFYNRGNSFFRNNQPDLAIQDFLAVLDIPDAPNDLLLLTHLCIAEIQWSNGCWPDGFATLDKALHQAQQYSLPIGTTNLIQRLFEAGLGPDNRFSYIQQMASLFGKHHRLSDLGEGLLMHTGNLYQKGAPFPSTDNLEQWADGWEQARKQEPDLSVGFRLFQTAIQVIKLNDQNILLNLVSTEREIVRQALGLS